MRLDKFLKNSRIIKRRTIAKEACDRESEVNGKIAKPGVELRKEMKLKLHLEQVY